MFSLNTFPKVSIIISTYNGIRYIGETIESVRSQTYTNWELIIIDDGSNDNTCEVITRIKDDRIYLCKAGRIGINGRIKNIGLSKSSGELIAFIDHDDLWAPAKLEKQVAALEQFPEAGFCLTGGYNFKDAGQPVNYFYKQNKGISVDHIFLSFFRSEISAWTQALLVRRECIEKAGAFNENSLFADPEFIVNLSSHFKAVMLYEPLVYHRLHDNSYSTIKWVQCHNQGLDIIRKYKNNRLLPISVARDALFRSHINFGEKYLFHKERRKAILHFYEAWKNKPLSIVPFKKTAKAILYTFKK